MGIKKTSTSINILNSSQASCHQSHSYEQADTLQNIPTAGSLSDGKQIRIFCKSLSLLIYLYIWLRDLKFVESLSFTFFLCFFVLKNVPETSSMLWLGLSRNHVGWVRQSSTASSCSQPASVSIGQKRLHWTLVF